MKKPTILITAASGCVGQYITSWLLKNSDAQLLLWVRDQTKLTAINANQPRVKLLIGDIRDSEIFSEELKTVTRLIHTATAWGDPKRAYQVNVKAVKSLLSLLDPNLIEQIIYFSTASILDKALEPLPEAFLFGTEYIQTKAHCLQELNSHPLSNKIVAVFPTLVLGGRVDGESKFPTSYLTQGLSESLRWVGLARWFRGYSRFHFIHAQDIAFICGKLALLPHNQKKYRIYKNINFLVLAQPSMTIDQAINILLEWKGMRKVPRVPLWGWLVMVLIRVLPIQMNSWDRFSIRKRHFDHDPITYPEKLGGRSYAKTLKEILISSGLPHY